MRTVFEKDNIPQRHAAAAGCGLPESRRPFFAQQWPQRFLRCPPFHHDLTKTNRHRERIGLFVRDTTAFVPQSKAAGLCRRQSPSQSPHVIIRTGRQAAPSMTSADFIRGTQLRYAAAHGFGQSIVQRARCANKQCSQRTSWLSHQRPPRGCARSESCVANETSDQGR